MMTGRAQKTEGRDGNDALSAAQLRTLWLRQDRRRTGTSPGRAIQADLG
jgi:hypothetical protein